jgi:large subunit ribosomal protein L6
MSRIGKKSVPVPAGVKADVNGQMVKVKGPKGELSLRVVDELSVEMASDGVKVTPRVMDRRGRAMWGMQRTLISNLITGVSKGYTQNLEITGVGFRAEVKPNVLSLALGYSHAVEYPIPKGIDIKCEKPTLIAISGMSAQQVGQVAAEIRGFREPEPYKGKGIKYAGEAIRRKEGKKK